MTISSRPTAWTDLTLAAALEHGTVHAQIRSNPVTGKTEVRGRAQVKAGKEVATDDNLCELAKDQCPSQPLAVPCVSALPEEAGYNATVINVPEKKAGSLAIQYFGGTTIKAGGGFFFDGITWSTE